jgi:hypothetical protein
MQTPIARGLLMTIGLLLAFPAWAGTQIEKSFPLNPGGRFILDSDGGSVSITGTDQSEAKVTITGNRDLENLFDFTFDASNAAVRIRAERRDHWGWFGFDLNMHYEIRVPKATALEIRTGGGGIEVNTVAAEARLKTSGGPIDVSGLNGRLLAETSGGPVRVTEIQGDAEVGTSGGGITADAIDGSLIAHTSGGGIHIHRVTGRIDAHTSGGGIVAVLSKKNDRGGVLESSGGSISATLDPAVNLEIDASTSGGSVVSDLPIHSSGWISTHALRGKLGSGGETLRMHTSGGSISINSL